MAEKPLKPADGNPPAPDARNDGPGRLAEDDRGNISWQWADDEELQADDDLGRSQRILALADPTLEIEQEQKPPADKVHGNPVGLTKGYNPYDSGELGKGEWKKKKDLKKLSEWIEARKRAASNKVGGGEDEK